ncbi:MAG: DUF2652 domain-containing protein [Bacteroidetes bacterium]|nr:DUF2652 domain-containing protein [Bacteroidota bacterium]
MEVCYSNQEAVILIPDISGFTGFVSVADTEHAQEIIALLLESVLDNNLLDFELSEIEGDAVLFYKLKPPFTANEVIQQCNKMFQAFHKILNEFKRKNCPCQSCKKLNDMSLKFIVHYGTLGSIMVNDYCKLFGKDLIIAHRLLKNNLRFKEYILLTDAFTNRFDFARENWKQKEIMIEELGLIGTYVGMLSKPLVIH